MPSSIFSNSSSNSSRGNLTPAKRRCPVKAEYDLTNVQKIHAIECGEESIELLVTIMSMAMAIKSKGKVYVSVLISDGDNFAMLDTTVDAMQNFTNIVDMSDYQNRTYWIKHITSGAYPKKTNLGDVGIGFTYSNRSAIVEVTKKEHLIGNCFPIYRPQLKFYLPENVKVKKVSSLDVYQLKKPVKVSIVAKVLGVTHEVKTCSDQRDAILTKIQIKMDGMEDDLEVACWGHTGVLLGHLMAEIVGASVGFADVDASAWVGRSSIGINLAFGPESKIRMPTTANQTPKRIAHAKLPEPPTTLQAIGGYEGSTLRECFIFRVSPIYSFTSSQYRPPISKACRTDE
jgi:hypothetical protein